jgi:hypothetical protein
MDVIAESIEQVLEVRVPSCGDGGIGNATHHCL